MRLVSDQKKSVDVNGGDVCGRASKYSHGTLTSMNNRRMLRDSTRAPYIDSYQRPVDRKNVAGHSDQRGC